MPLNNPTAAVEIKTGTYTGNNSVNRAIPHGLSKTPKLIKILSTSTKAEIHGAWGRINAISASDPVPNLFTSYEVTAPGTTNFYVGNPYNWAASANLNPLVHYWIAIA